VPPYLKQVAPGLAFGKACDIDRVAKAGRANP
jgi:hypothetical protein